MRVRAVPRPQVSRGVALDGHHKGTALVLVRWAGWGPGHDTWEPEEHISAALVDAFVRRAQEGHEEEQSAEPAAVAVAAQAAVAVAAAARESESERERGGAATAGEALEVESDEAASSPRQPSQAHASSARQLPGAPRRRSVTPQLWVACDDCGKWRRIPYSMRGTAELLDSWTCRMHPDPANVRAAYVPRLRRCPAADGLRSGSPAPWPRDAVRTCLLWPQEPA